jgi:hypothetical protein
MTALWQLSSGLARFVSGIIAPAGLAGKTYLNQFAQML